jgi:hypothetical protein
MFPFELRTASVHYWLIGGIIGLPTTYGLYIAVARMPAVWPPTLMLGGSLAFVLVLFLSTKLTLTHDIVHYRSLFVTRDISLDVIARAQFLVGFSGYKPYQRIVVTVRTKEGEKDVTINTGLFDRAEIRRWMGALNAQISSR